MKPSMRFKHREKRRAGRLRRLIEAAAAMGCSTRHVWCDRTGEPYDVYTFQEDGPEEIVTQDISEREGRLRKGYEIVSSAINDHIRRMREIRHSFEIIPIVTVPTMGPE